MDLLYVLLCASTIHFFAPSNGSRSPHSILDWRILAYLADPCASSSPDRLGWSEAVVALLEKNHGTMDFIPQMLALIVILDVSLILKMLSLMVVKDV